MFWLWTGFVVFVLVMLALDLFVVNRKAHVVRSREAIGWTMVTVVLALAFSGVVYVMYDRNTFGVADYLLKVAHAKPYGQAAEHHVSIGREAMIQFIAGWLTEYSLSLDNIFVIAIIFSYFRVPPQYQHRVLFWGVLGALVMRGGMIWLGVELLHKFSWMSYVLGGFLILTALKMLLTGDSDLDPERGLTVRVARQFLRMTPDFEGERFFTRLPATGALAATPLFLVLLVVETTDVIFAVDSIPAIFSITKDPFLVFTSNVFAILGLRSLYFALAAFIGKFRYLKISLVFVLAFVGVKMLLENVQHIGTEVSLGVIVTILGIGIAASLLASRREQRPAPVTDLAEAAEEAWRRSRRYVILVIGSTIVLFGLAFGALPGPGGIPIVLAGLALLATEFVWAKRLLTYARQKAESTLQKQGPWLTVFGLLTILVGVLLMAFHHRMLSTPVVISGVFVVLTELVYNRYLRRRRAAATEAQAVRPQPTPAEELQPKEHAT